MTALRAVPGTETHRCGANPFREASWATAFYRRLAIEHRDADLSGSRFRNVDLSGTRIRSVNLNDVVITDAWVDDVRIEGEVRSLTVNGVDVHRHGR